MKKFLVFMICICMHNAFGGEKHIDLVVAYKTVNFTGQSAMAIAVNDQISGPTLHFKEGDHVVINVYNHLDKPTAIHWHGLLVPWQMDGVEGVSQKAIPAGGVFHYQFTLKQAGTYWYHAHAGLQEQQGLYGGFIIDPLTPPSYQYHKDFVVVLSDWNNANPEQTLANLKKAGDYYSPKFPLQPSLMKFLTDYHHATPAERQYLLNDYKMMQQMRMSIYDLSDVAYDAFLLNGQPKFSPWTGLVKVGDIVRLRFIGAGGDTIFHVKIPNSTMTMVHVEGNNIVPYPVQDFTIAPGETDDVLVKIEKNEPYIIYAESKNTLGAAYGALITSVNQLVDYTQVQKFPQPNPVTREMMDNMMQGMNTTAQPSAKKHSMPNKSMTNSQMMHGMTMDSLTKTESTAHSMPHQMPMPDDAMHHLQMEKNHQHMSMDSPTATESTTHSMQHQMTMPEDHAHHMQMNKKHQHMSMDMSMPMEPSIIGDKISAPPMAGSFGNEAFAFSTFGTKYQELTAAVATNDPHKPIEGVINMELFGYMDRFIWFINGLPEYQAHPIALKAGKRYRIIFINNSMMHHPMHLHGHWFILRNGHGQYDPLLHTIDVPPGSTITVDVDTDASGQWFFHCHLLYHMLAGMSRVFQYSTLLEILQDEVKPQNMVANSTYENRPIIRVDEIHPLDPSLIHHPMAHPPGFWFANFLDFGVEPFDTQRLTFKGLYGGDYNKLELLTNDAEIYQGSIENADLDIFYWHLISQFWAVKAGINYFYRPALTPYWQPGIGVEGLMPYFIEADLRAYFHHDNIKLDIELSRDTQITNNFFIRAAIRSILGAKTVTQDQVGSGLNQMRYSIRPYYRLRPGLELFTEYEHEQYYGPFKNMQSAMDEPTVQNTFTLGLSYLF